MIGLVSKKDTDRILVLLGASVRGAAYLMPPR